MRGAVGAFVIAMALLRTNAAAQGFAQPGLGFAQPGVGFAQPGVGFAQPGVGLAAPGLAMRATASPFLPTALPRPLGGLPFRSAWPLPIAPRAASGTAEPGAQCRAAIAAAERSHALPPGLLEAIGQVETGRRAPDGRISPWPYSINVEGTDHVYDTKAEAVAAVQAFQQSGVRSIDVGCLQINLMHHPNAFASLEEAFDPGRNAAYAADFLVQLRDQTGSWAAATADYHSATPELGGPYAAKVNAIWAAEGGQPALTATMPGRMQGGMPARLGGLFPFSAGGMQRHGGLLIRAATYNPAATLTFPGAIPGGAASGPSGAVLGAHQTVPLAASSAASWTVNSGTVSSGAVSIPGVTAGRSLAAYRLLPVRTVSGQHLR